MPFRAVGFRRDGFRRAPARVRALAALRRGLRRLLGGAAIMGALAGCGMDAPALHLQGITLLGPEGPATFLADHRGGGTLYDGERVTRVLADGRGGATAFGPDGATRMLAWGAGRGG